MKAAGYSLVQMVLLELDPGEATSIPRYSVVAPEAVIVSFSMTLVAWFARSTPMRRVHPT